MGPVRGTRPPLNLPQPTPRRAGRLLGRALRLRCPHCGQGGMFLSWLRMRKRCPSCGLVLERGESDYFIGAYLLNLIIAELIVVALMLAFLLVTWPAVPWQLVLWATALLTIPGVLVTYPFSRALWLAIDLLFRPAEARDFDPEVRGPSNR